jgi:glycerol-3-phosphate dehydrogenase
MRKLGVRTITLNGIKYRTLAMFGTCQGSFCRLRVARIISKQLGIPVWKISLEGRGTEYGLGDIKILQKGRR